MALIEIAQTLHGYAEGHRLLATGGDVDDRERSILDRLSDLSGYLPSGVEFERYHTGFPCGRYYAFACTWPDLTANRDGTVSTHTLLIPNTALERTSDLAVLTQHHRRPLSGTDSFSYQKPLSIDPSGGSPPALDAQTERAALGLFFGNPQRPILWVSARPSLEVPRRLWQFLWPARRAAFAFCTFALQVRRIDGRVFDYMGLPPAARGSFHDIAGRGSWSDDGKVSDELKGLSEQLWIMEMQREGPQWVEQLVARGRSIGLPDLAPSDLPIAKRFFDLEMAAHDRLPAARARADLLARLWPDLDAQSAIWSDVVSDLLRLQSDAPVEPRPLWELADFLRRPQIVARAERDRGLREAIGRLISHELSKRLRLATRETAAEWQALLRGVEWSFWRTSLVRGALSGLEAIPQEQVPVAGQLLAEIIPEPDGPSIAEALRHFPPEDRIAVLRSATAAASPGRTKTLLSSIAAAAEELGDVALLFHALRFDGDLRAAFDRAVTVALSQTPPALTALEALLNTLDPETRLRCAVSLDIGRGGMEELAIRVTNSAWTEASVAPGELGLICEDAPAGVTVFAAAAREMTPDATFDSMRAAPRLATRIVSAALEDRRAPISFELLLVAIRVSLPTLTASDGIAPILLRALCAGGMSSSDLLVSPARSVMLSWARGASGWDLKKAAFDETGASAVVNLLQFGVGAWVPATEKDREALERLFSLIGDAPPRLLLEAVEQARDLFRLPLGTRTEIAIANRVLAAVAGERDPRAAALVELTFKTAYDDLPRRSWTLNLVGESPRARKRRWLLDAWVDRDWPVDGFLRTLRNDIELFRRLVELAGHWYHWRAFMNRLPNAFSDDPELRAFWSDPVARAIRYLE